MNIAAVKTLFALLAKIGVALKFWKIIWNAPRIYRFVRKYRGILSELVRRRELPSGQQTAEFLREAAVIVRAKVLDLPGIEEDDLAIQLENLASEILNDKAKANAA